MHGREVLAGCLVTLKQETLVFTASEDTCIKVSSVAHGGTNLQPYMTLANHVGSVRALAKTKVISERRQHLIVSAGSRLEANVYLLDDESRDIQHVCHFIKSNM